VTTVDLQHDQDTLMIPAAVLADVRKALFSLMGDAMEELDTALTLLGHERHPEWFETGRGRLDSVFVLLDMIGWSEASPPCDVAISLERHGENLRAALDSLKADVEDELAEVDANDNRRAAEGIPPRKDEIVRRSAAFHEFRSLIEQRCAARAHHLLQHGLPGEPLTP
jgi:hypothetical protein